MLAKQVNFGGLYPMARPRQLPDDGAQVCHNLLASVTDFQPLPGDATVATALVNAPQTLYRMQRVAGGAINTDPATGWKAYADIRHFAKSQVNGDTTERTLVTVYGGASAPRVIDVNGMDRLAGVPRPDTELTQSVNAGTDYTPEDRTNAITGMEGYITQIMTTPGNGVVGTAYRGVSPPGTNSVGFIDLAGVPDCGLAPTEVGRVYKLSSTGGTNSGAIDHTYADGVPPEQLSWVSSLGAITTWRTSTDDWPSWAFKPFDHFIVKMPLYARVLTFNPDTYQVALSRIVDPSTGNQLLTADQITAMTVLANKQIDAAYAAENAKVAVLNSAYAQAQALLGGTAAGAAAGSYTAFYSNAGVSQEIGSAVAAFAENVWQQANAIATGRLPDSSGG